MPDIPIIEVDNLEKIIDLVALALAHSSMI